jgi:hypothetical protein
MNTTELRIDKIRADGGTQTRANVMSEVVEKYAEEMQAGASFPPMVVFYDGKTHWLADGFHRLAALRKAKVATVGCDVRQGTARDAILFSVGANATHGAPRTNADKRRAVETLLRDEEWSQWSDREIARRAVVSHNLACSVRQELASVIECQMKVCTDKQGSPERKSPRKVVRGAATYKQSVVGRKTKTKRRTKPADEVDAITEVKNRLRATTFAWRTLASEWEARRRFDMSFAFKASAPIVEGLVAVEHLIDEVLAECARADASGKT